MGSLIVTLLDGLGSGAVYGALALALVVTYRSSGVVNFATGAMALYTAYTFSFLRRGELLIPFPGPPATIDLGGNLTVPSAFAISMALAGVLGVLLHLLVFRPLRNAPAAAKAVASIGVLLVIQAALAQRVGTSPVSTPPILPGGTTELFGQSVRMDRLWFAAVIVLVTLALAAMFRFTRFGLATRAVAETEKGALVTGLSTDRIAMTSWALSAMVAGLAGILISPIVPVIPVSYTLFIVPALAAALMGSFTSVVPAVAAGLAIGMLQSQAVQLPFQHDWLPRAGLAELIPLALILTVLVVRGRPLPTRGAVVLRSLGRAPRPRAPVAAAGIGVVLGASALLLLGGSYQVGLTLTFIYALLALSWVVVTGYAGQLSLAQLSLAGVGAFALSRFASDWNVPFPVAPLLAATVAMVVGVVIGLPALRIRGLPVAVVTLALAVALEGLWFRNQDFNGGISGAPVEAPSLFGWEIATDAVSSRVPFGLFCLGVLVAAGLAIAALRRSRLGAAMLAVRANERSAAASGIDVARTKVVAFAIGSFIAGLAGSLLAYQQGAAVPETYNAVFGIAVFAVVYLAGITSIFGAVLAGLLALKGVVFVFADDRLSFGEWYATATGVVLVLTVVLNPEGLARFFHGLLDRVRDRAEDQEPAVLGTGDRTAAPAAQGPRAVPSPSSPDQGVPAVPLLELREVSVTYDGVAAVDHVDLVVTQGEIAGLIGPNGAGKTSLMDAVSGFTPAAGSVDFEGQALQGLAPFERVRRGLGRTFQGVDLYDDLTVEENIVVGTEAARRRRPDDQAAGLDEVYATLGIGDLRHRPVAELSSGVRQLVSVGRALAGRPAMVLLDEPAGGLDSSESEWLGERLRRIRDDGVTILLIDHDMHLVLDVCDRIHVLDLGRLIASGSPHEVRNDPDVAAAYLGDTHSGAAAR